MTNNNDSSRVALGALDVYDVTKRYGQHPAVQGISFSVAAGEVVAFLGPNGAGKTTTLKMIAGLLQPDHGEIRICGHRIAAADSHLPLGDGQPDPRHLLGYVPDRPYLYERLNGREFLAFVADLFGMDARVSASAASHWLHRLGLAAFADERIEQYSHGMKQRLVMAAAFFRQPKVLVIDEPMVGLDPRGARLVKSVFREAAARGAAVLLSTHSLAVAEEVCDRAIIIHRGSIVAHGTPAALRTQAGMQDGALEDVFLALTESEAEEVGIR